MSEEKTVRLEFEDLKVIRALCGVNEANVRLLQRRVGVTMSIRGGEVVIRGDEFAVDLGEAVWTQLYNVSRKGHPVYKPDLIRAIDMLSADRNASLESVWLDTVLIHGSKTRIAPKNVNQKAYVEAIRSQDVVFGVGPAGTGKTYLAMAMAVASLGKSQYKRIVLTRPAVEAGERLGFLPGDLADKVNPYLRPLYDALNDMMDVDQAGRMVEKGVIEVAPLAFMRGRTLNDAFVILDEAQNATIEQMKMFLTRLGYNSKAVITGDVTQTDLDPGRMSGLAHALGILSDINGIGVVQFTDRDVVRHPLVQRIIVAYEKAWGETQAAREAARQQRHER
ncbi:MAG: phosphate starvation-inducible PhoH-like protein [Myxococcota bacterium]|jgi:phosphate starvation-inducible PhoH-like protein